MNAFDLRAETVYRWIMGSPDLPAERRRGASLEERSARSASTLTPYPWLLATVVGSLGVLFVLAVVGAYALIRAVLG